MKIQPKFIVKIAGTLLVISLVVAGLLGLVNGVTADKIAAINAENTAAAMNQVVTVENAEYTPLEISEDVAAAAAAYATLDSLYEVRAGGELAGYTVKIIASGSQGSIEMMVGTDTAGAVTGVAIVDHSETSGIGSKVMTNVNGVLDQFKGMSGAGTLAVGQNVDAISGATVSSKGVTAGVNAALAAVEALG
ncbi:MAG: FMN-binding protein [Oscillospiraceae bacterium]